MNAIGNFVALVSRSSIANITSKRLYAFKSDLKINWVRPEKVPCYNPEKSGDLETLPTIDGSQILLQFRNSQELASADDTVKHLFSVDFAPRKKAVYTYTHDLVQKVKRHPYDVGSVEVTLAKWTGTIRAFQDLMELFPRDKRLKVKLKELIDKRKKLLKSLRKWDYKRFEWALEVLNLVYKPPPEKLHWVTRKESLRKLTDKYCDGIKQEQLNAYKLVLEKEQPIFLQEKIRLLQFVRDEQSNCGVAVTITEEEIEKVKQQLKALEDEGTTVQDE